MESVDPAGLVEADPVVDVFLVACSDQPGILFHLSDREVACRRGVGDVSVAGDDRRGEDEGPVLVIVEHLFADADFDQFFRFFIDPFDVDILIFF